MSRQIHTLYVSDKLKDRHFNVWKRLKDVCSKKQIDFKEISGTKDIWCRDYMPIQVNGEKYVLFDYNPSYLKKYKSLHTKVNDILPFIKDMNVVYSPIKLDGGNVVSSNYGKTVITSRVFSENAEWNKVELIDEISNLLESEIIIIPTEPGDLLGHADGMVKFINHHKILVNDYSKVDVPVDFINDLERALAKADLNIVSMPYFQSDKKTRDGLYTAHGCYINFVKVGDMVLFPRFCHEYDNRVEDILQKEYGLCTKSVCANDLANEGGVLNCITWTTVA